MMGVSMLRIAARKIGLFPCASFSKSRLDDSPHENVSSSQVMSSAKGRNVSEITEDLEFSPLDKNLCTICLEPLIYGEGASSCQAIFTAQCSHAFHFICISSNVRHGNVTCPICRAHWTQLPRNFSPLPTSCPQQTDPILRILDDSIATIRVHRRSSLRSARYDDDDPVEPEDLIHPRLRLALIPVPLVSSHRNFPPCGHSHPPSLQLSSRPPPTSHTSPRVHSPPVWQFTSSSSSSLILQPNGQEAPPPPYLCSSSRAYHLSVKLGHQRATDLVLVVSTNGPHLRLLKQSMALVVFSLRSVDRLAIVTYSSTATRAFPLKRMSSHGKRTALQVIDRLFYQGEADPREGLRKGIKILEDRTHHNPHSCILHLSDGPTRASYLSREMQEARVPIHCFRAGFGFGTSNGFVMHEFEEFLSRLLGAVIRETQLRIGEEGLIRLGEMRSGEERRIALDLGDCGYICVRYSYIEGGVEECLRTGEIIVGITDKGDRNDDGGGGEVGGRDLTIGGRTSSVERWDYHDPYMARRWAKHLHGYRL